MTIRARLTIIYTATIILTLAVVGGVVWWQVGAALVASLDTTLATRAADALAAHENQGQVGLQDVELSDPALTFVVLYGPSGEIFDATSTTPRAFLDLPLPPSGDAHIGDARYRVYVDSDDNGIVALAGSNLQGVVDALTELGRWLMLVVTLAAGVSTLTGWWLAGRALRPVANLTDEATRIGATDLDARLPLPPKRDEIGDLTVTLNSMIDRLAESVRRERRFIAAASHELRTPVTALQTELELADAADTGETQLRAAIRDAHADAARLAELTTSLLSLASLGSDGQAVVRAPVAVDVLLHSAVRRVLAQAKTRGVHVAIDAPTTTVNVDRIRLETAVANLTMNAVIYGPAEAQVDVKAHVEGDPSRSQASLVIEVQDRGPGIPEGSEGRLFEPFQRGSGVSTPGAGLGLATAMSAVNAHGGSIGVSARPGGGSVLRLRVPA